MTVSSKDIMNVALDLAALPEADIQASVLRTAQLSLFDWLVCGRAGIGEPLSLKMRAFAQREGGHEMASVFGGVRVPARMATLINGATSHALDFDDTHFAHIGHLSVGIYPAALAAGEEVGASANAIIAAFFLGAEVAIRIGMVLGTEHYNRGFHQTATAGAFGATVAAARLYGLNRTQMRAALGLCATRASGLKSQFGTMGKPYNAGIAAANGVECASLAGLGMTSCADGRMGDQGFVSTHCDNPGSEIAPVGEFLFSDVSYKFHACCHGTHAMIEALLDRPESQRPSPMEVVRLSLRTNPRWLSVCDIAKPTTGLEVKFSYRWLAGMVLSGMETGAFDTYRDELAADPRMASFAQKVEVRGDPTVSDMQAEGEIELTDGRVVSFAHDLAQTVPMEAIEAKLRTKSLALLGKSAEQLVPVLGLHSSMSADSLGQMMRASS